MILTVAFVIFGIIFFCAGCYFSSKKFGKSLAETRTDENAQNRIKKAAKMCGYVSMGTGALTIFCGILAGCYPAAQPFFMLFYVAALMVAFIIISTTFNQKY